MADAQIVYPAPVYNRKYTSKCPNGDPHSRITGNQFIQRYYPQVWDQLPRIDWGEKRFHGWEWQYCVKCGDCVLTDVHLSLPWGKDLDTIQTGRYYTDPAGRVRVAEPKGKGVARDATRLYLIRGLEYVTTTVAAKYLEVQRPTIRDWIRKGELDAVREQVKGCTIWLVSLDSLYSQIAARYGPQALTDLMEYFQGVREAVNGTEGVSNA